MPIMLKRMGRTSNTIAQKWWVHNVNPRWINSELFNSPWINPDWGWLALPIGTANDLWVDVIEAFQRSSRCLQAQTEVYAKLRMEEEPPVVMFFFVVFHPFSSMLPGLATHLVVEVYLNTSQLKDYYPLNSYNSLVVATSGFVSIECIETSFFPLFHGLAAIYRWR